jgi:UDP:flavonoid glycosyltransferase YjiC (YdhE family)
MTTFDGFEPKLVELVQERIEASKKLRIVAIALGEMGHLLPVVRLVAALEASGHEVAAILTNGGARERATAILTQM